MNWVTTTQYLIIAVTVIVVLYDVAARVFGGSEATVSCVLADAGDRYPVIVGAVFAVVAHIFWPVR